MAGRKPNPEPEAQRDTLNTEALTEDSAALTQLASRNADIVERFGDGHPYERGRVLSEVRFFMAQASEGILQTGKRLILIKEHEPHGEWTEIVTQQLGMNKRTAQVAMQVAAKFLAPALASKSAAYALLGTSKLLDLVAEPDEDLAELAEGGTLAGHTIDEVRAMSVKELRAALTDARKAIDAKDKVIKAKSKKLDDLDEAAAMREHAPLDEQESAQLFSLRDTTLEAESCLQRLLVTVDEVSANPVTEAAGTAARQSLDYLVQRIVDGCLSRGITVDLAERLSPIWAEPIEAAAKAGAKARK